MDSPPELGPEQQAILARAKLLVLDVDGVLTDGRVVWCGGTEIQAFHAHDGQALRWLQARGVRVAWISGRGCEATERRAGELGIDELHLRSGEKGAELRSVQARLGLGPDATVAMGDDFPDLALAANSAFFCAPANARPEVRARADWVTSRAGGSGAVRELAELILQAQGHWEAIGDSCGP